MNKEDYVSLEVAKFLKEKGFNEECGSAYDKDGNVGEYTISLNWNEVYSWAFSRPTLYEAAKWLRINHKINISVFFYSNVLGYGAILKNIGDGTDIGEEVKLFDEYEEALNAGILEALKFI